MDTDADFLENTYMKDNYFFYAIRYNGNNLQDIINKFTEIMLFKTLTSPVKLVLFEDGKLFYINKGDWIIEKNIGQGWDIYFKMTDERFKAEYKTTT